MTKAFINVGSVPQRIEARAAAALACSKPRKLKYACGEVIEVGLRYRLFRARGATCFSLMSHERYNRMTSKKKRRG